MPPSTILEDVQRQLIRRAGMTERFVGTDGRRVHVIESGSGPPLVVIHGTGNSGTFLLPLLERLEGVRAIAIDRPGFGQTDPHPTRGHPRERAVAWIDGVLDDLGLNEAALLGHSMGGLWSVWYAIERPERLTRLVVLGGAPALPGARAPLPFRMMAIPGLGRILQRPTATPVSVLRFAAFVREREALAARPEILELMVASTNDPTTKESVRREVRELIPPYAIVSPASFRTAARVDPGELSRIGAPTLIVWGDREPVGTIEAARGLAATIADATLEVVPGGHAPWLGQAERVAALVSRFLDTGD